MKHIFFLLAGLCVPALAMPCNAQISDFEHAILGQAMEARVGITIPFGGDGKSNNSKPQLALIARKANPERGSIDWAMKPSFDQNNYVETRLALTLSDTPELRLNDQSIYHFNTGQADLSDDVKTAGKIALGAAAVVVVAGAVFLAVLVTADPDDGG